MNHQGELGKWNANVQFSYIHIHVIKVRRSILVVRRLAVLSYLPIRFRSIHQALISPYSFSSMPPLDRPREFSPYIQRFYLFSRKIFDRSQLASIKIRRKNKFWKWIYIHFYRVKMETTLWKRFINGENDIRCWWKEVRNYRWWSIVITERNSVPFVNYDRWFWLDLVSSCQECERVFSILYNS